MVRHKVLVPNVTLHLGSHDKISLGILVFHVMGEKKKRFIDGKQVISNL